MLQDLSARMIRLFTALSLPQDLRFQISSLRAGIDNARWVKPENLHITVRFIGEVREDLADIIINNLAFVSAPTVPIELKGTGHFSSRGIVRALWVGVAMGPALSFLQLKVDKCLLTAGLAPERRRYTPHITVARPRTAHSKRIREWLETTGGFSASTYQADTLTLYQSHLGRKGPAYIPLAQYPLDFDSHT